ncbi:AI-2E family transporter [Bradyrhizobium lablabi]|uniref:AI-2E family transporter n=1 Tax=Bradyrhizobium lablabi TaxID=722472 RepID=UPI001BA8767E|nr:AI-2E family transporter [Bradyrhizobium lablabi]MBR1120972.1 AI-2E family transporter [Bradyrhizobium lablabi]
MRTIRQLLAGEDEIQLAVRLALLALLIYWSFVVIRPFVPILAWSMVLTVALYPVFNWLSRLLGHRPKTAATILTLINLGIVIGPATWLGLGAVEGLRSFAAQLSAGTVAIPSPPPSVRDWPIIGQQAYGFWDQASTNLRALVGQVAPQLKPLAGTMLGLAGDAGVGTLKFLVAVALTGFLFPAGPRLVAASKRFLSRVVAERSVDFLALAGATIRSVAQGVIGIAVAQGLVIGIIMKLADVPWAGLLAFAVMMLGILQIGSAIIVIPVLIWVWMTKSFAVALVITLCILPASLADNVLKPIVMGRGLTTPALVIFLGVIGGTLAHGIVGLFIGPIILAVVWELLTAWVRDDDPLTIASDTDVVAKDRELGKV